SVATLQLRFMAQPPIADRDTAPPLASSPGTPKGTNRCLEHRCGRDRWKASEASPRLSCLRDTSRPACEQRYAASRARAAPYYRQGASDRSRGTNARKQGERTALLTDSLAPLRRSLGRGAIRGDGRAGRRSCGALCRSSDARVGGETCRTWIAELSA